MTMRCYFVLLLLIAPVWAQDTPSEPTSLVELARREKERRAAIQKEVPLITNEDLARLRGARVSISGPSTRQPARRSQVVEEDSSAEAEATAASPEGPDLEAWREAFREATLEYRMAVNKGQVLQLKMNNLRNAYFSEQDGATQERLHEELDRTFRELSSTEAEIESARQEVENLEREAIRSGIAVGDVRGMKGELPTYEKIITPESANP